MTIALIALGLILVCAGIMLFLFVTATEGYQDAAGFHEGPTPVRDVDTAIAPYLRDEA